jgi:hypothetical protein
MNRKTKALLGVSHAVVLAIGLAAGLTLGGLLGLYVHSSTHLGDLRHQAAYPTPEQAMQALIAESYVGIQRVEIVSAGKDSTFLNDLHFVTARVWAERRADGRIPHADGDLPGCYFLRLETGWVLVPEGRWPALIALGKRLFRLSG